MLSLKTVEIISRASKYFNNLETAVFNNKLQFDYDVIINLKFMRAYFELATLG